MHRLFIAFHASQPIISAMGPYLDFFIHELPDYGGATNTYGGLFIEVDNGTDESFKLTLADAVEPISAKRGLITDSNLTVSATNRLLGRQTAGAGAVQELALGGGVSFSAGVLVIDHGGIGGLADDDHTQYYNEARGDARYAHKSNPTLAGTITFADEAVLTFGTTLGTRIGTATNEKLAFWNATPIVQPTALADVTGGATVDAEVRTALNALLAKLRATGLIAT